MGLTVDELVITELQHSSIPDHRPKIAVQLLLKFSSS